MDNSKNIIQVIFFMAGPRPKDGAYQSGQHVVQPRAGAHVVLEVALAAQLGAICCRRHRGGADPGARGAARPAASLHKAFPFT